MPCKIRVPSLGMAQQIPRQGGKALVTGSAMALGAAVGKGFANEFAKALAKAIANCQGLTKFPKQRLALYGVLAFSRAGKGMLP